MTYAYALAQDGTSPYFGALVGRVANRIADATFQLDGKTYHVTPNENKTSLHGGKFGFSRHLWEGQPFTSQSGSGVKLRYHSPDGDEVRRITWTVQLLQWLSCSKYSKTLEPYCADMQCASS